MYQIRRENRPVPGRMKTASKEWWNTPRGLTLNRVEVDWRAEMDTTRRCSFGGCDRKHCAGGYCSAHWQQARKGRTLKPIDMSRHGLTPLERLDSRTDKSGECWEWTGPVTSGGYASITIDRRKYYSHRVIYAARVGPIPEGFDVDHKCRNRRCLRPSHLQAVLPKVNHENLSPIRSNNTSGVRGVHWNTRLRKWQARVTHHNTAHNVGLFTDLAEATAAVVAKRRELFTNSLMDDTNEACRHVLNQDEYEELEKTA